MKKMNNKLNGLLTIIVLLMGLLVPATVLLAQPDPTGGTAPARGQGAALVSRPTTVPGPEVRGGRGRGGFGTGGGPGIGVGGGRGGIVSMAAPGEGPTCALDATIYDVRLPADQIGRIDLNALTRASATVADFEKALAELGTAKPIYRANQSVRLAGDSITIGTTTPYVSSSQTTAQGNVINTVQYSNIGALLGVAGKSGAPNSIELDMSIQVSSLSEGTTQVSATVKAPLFRQVTMSYKGMVEAQKPFLALSVDAASVDPNGKAVAYIARVILGAPQSAGSPRGG